MSTQDRAEKIEALKKHLTANKVSEKTVKSIVANKKLSTDQMEMLMSMDPEQLKMAAALAGVLAEGEGVEEPEQMEEEIPEAMEFDEEEKPMATNQVKTFTAQDVEKIVANQLRRQKVVDKLTANESCAFDESDIKSMSVDALEKYEASIRPADYSGSGGFAANSDAVDTNVTPLVANGLLNRKKEA